jgi:hypothetical protein
MQRTYDFRAKVTRGCVAALLVLASGTARAQQEHPPIVLVLDPCAGVDAQEVRRLVPIEMGAPLVSDAGDPRETTRVSLGCDPSAPHVVRLEVHNPTTGKTLARVLALGDVPRPDQSRLVAIAAVELVAASWSALGHSPEEVPPPPPPRPPAPPTPVVTVVVAPPPPPPPAPRWHVLVVGSARRFSRMPNATAGGGVAVARATPPGFGVTADAIVESGAQLTSLGTVDALLVSASVEGVARVRTGLVTWEPGVGARLGWARLTGQGGVASGAPAFAGALAGTWFGPLVALRGRLALPRRFVVSLGAEVGDATAGLRGRVDGLDEVSVLGVWWNAMLGVGHAF